MSFDGASDVELVREFKGGNPDAYNAIVRRFQDRVFRLACVWLYDEQAAFFTKRSLGLPDFLPVNDDPFLEPGAALLVDLEVAYRISDNFRLAVGANNLLDEKPDRLADDSAIQFISRGNIQFPMRGLAYGLNGGFYYSQLTVNF